jgi:hypothetical protein
MYSLPLRRTILQSTLRFLIEALTFILFCFSVLLVSEIDPTPCQIVWRKFYTNFVARQNADVMHPHFSGDRGQNFVTVFKLYPEHSIRQCFQNNTILLDQRLFRHTILRGAKIGRYQGITKKIGDFFPDGGKPRERRRN